MAIDSWLEVTGAELYAALSEDGLWPHRGDELGDVPRQMAWTPAISFPAGATSQGLPVGLQLMAPRGNDALLLRLARLWEQEVGGFPPPAMPSHTAGS